MKELEPRHVRRGRATATYRNGEPTEIITEIEYYVHTPEKGPEFELTEAGETRYPEDEQGHILDALYEEMYQLPKSDRLDRFEELKTELAEDGYYSVTVRDGTTYKLHADEIEYSLEELEGEFSDGITAEFVFDVNDGEAVLDHIQNIDGVVDDGVSIKVLRLLPAAIEQTDVVPGVDEIEDPEDIVYGYIQEGATAVWD